MRKLLICIIFAITAVFVYAENKIELMPGTYDFGVIMEKGGPRTGRVKLVNHGPDATFIRQVRPSCGCTDADYMPGEIAPGDTAWVSFTYNPKGRPGRFEKTVRVVLGDDRQRELITIKGTVLATPETIESKYPVDAGPLRLKEDKIFIPELRKGTARHYFITAYNLSPDTIAPRLVSDSEAVDVEMSSPLVAPGDLVTFSFYINSRYVDTVGNHQFKVSLYTAPAVMENAEKSGADDKKESESAYPPHEITIFAEIK